MLRNVTFLFLILSNFLVLLSIVLWHPSKSLFLQFTTFMVGHIIISIVITKILNTFFPIIEGSFTRDSTESYRWQAHGIVALSCCLYLEPLIPFLFKPNWYRLFGVPFGKNSTIVGKIVDLGLTKIGDNATIGADSLIVGHQISGDKIVIGKVEMQDGSTLGAKSILFPNCTLKKGSTLGSLSLATTGTIIGEEEVWVGIPARPLSKNES